MYKNHTDIRPDPTALLQQVQKEQTQQGRLKIFFGAAPGVGKTYAMLETAHQLQTENVDVVVGCIDTHGRQETEALVAGLVLLPQRQTQHRGAQFAEFDLDAALARHPKVILIDELAHTNAPGSRHPKRYQDVLELLEAGIDVYTTLNVQHVESLNDVVAQITHIRVRETVPDALLESASEIELIDVSPEELLERLKEGKVYVPSQAQQALQHFFRKGNLLALRELALRRTADRVDADIQAYRRAHGIASAWHTSEHILVCLGPNSLSERLVRSAKRMADRLQASWTAIYVESLHHEHLPAAKRTHIEHNMRLAESLGATTIVQQSTHIADALLQYARSHSVTKLLLGKPSRSRWRDVVFGSLVDTLIRRSDDIDVYVIPGQAEPTKSQNSKPTPKRSFKNYVLSVVVVLLATALGFVSRTFVDLPDILMLYLLSIVLVAAKWGRGPSAVASCVSVGLFDFCFVAPLYTFAVSDVKYIFTFSILLSVGLLISHLTAQVRWQAEAARLREQRTSHLYALSRRLSQTLTSTALAEQAAEALAVLFESSVVMLSTSADSADLRLLAQSGTAKWQQHEASIAQWAYEHKEPAGLGTNTLPGNLWIYIPLVLPSGCTGVVGLHPQTPHFSRNAIVRDLLQACLDQIALALERTKLSEAAQQAALRAEKEEVRNTLLRSISHDLRTPLAVITGTTSTLLEQATHLTTTQQELLLGIHQEANHLNKLVGNLLDMTRLESGHFLPNKEWIPLEELVGAALHRLERPLFGYPITTDLPIALPLIHGDGVLLEQVFFNLLENITHHTPKGTCIEIRARAQGSLLNIAVADKGPGLPTGTEELVFEKFYRLDTTRKQGGGVGLGLALCRAIVDANGGTISALNRSQGGVVFCLSLPLVKPPNAEDKKFVFERDVST